ARHTVQNLKQRADGVQSYQNWLSTIGIADTCAYSDGSSEGPGRSSWGYCSSAKNDARVPTYIEILTSTVAILRLNKTGEVDTQPNFKNHSIVLSHERFIKWDKDASVVTFWLQQCYSYDYGIIEEQETPKKAWDTLNMKYSKVKAGDLRKLEREITSFDRESQAQDGLSEPEWQLTKDTLDAQPNLDYDDKLDVLQQVWERTLSLQNVQEEGTFIAKS
ncbi:hypothetical protein OnM2_035100, partial [Erysiphe neolycopersici]